MDSGDKDASLDDSSSKAGHETSSTTTLTCALLPGVSTSKENRIENTIFEGEDARGPDVATLNPQECRASGWLDIDDFPDYHWGFEDNIAKGKPQEKEDIQDELGRGRAKDKQAKDGLHEIEHNISGAEDGLGDEDEVGRVKNNGIADLEMDGIDLDGEGFHRRDGYKARADGDIEV